MRIESFDVGLAASHTAVERDEKSENLQMWVNGKRPQGAAPAQAQGISDRLTLSGETPPEQSQVEGDLKGDKTGMNGHGKHSMLDYRLQLIKAMVEALTGKKINVDILDDLGCDPTQAAPADLQDAQATPADTQETEAAQPDWGVAYDSSESHYESEQLSFQAKGTINTADGQEIKFKLDLQMSREFYSEQNFSLRAGSAKQVDPLTINFGGSAAELTDTKFSFDLDSDGEDENISFVRPGSGLLALDRNGDGTINDGKELFGPSTGNGFSELAAFDEDCNGWIDEADSIFSKLSVWTKSASGQDSLASLKDAGVGAIYLGSVASPFSINDESNSSLGQLNRTGIYVKENGEVNTIQQVDFSV